MIPEHLIKRYDVPERVPKSKTGPALHNVDMEQKRPRRKDTPALHMPPFVAGKLKISVTEHSQEWWEQIGRASPSGGARGMACVLAQQAALHSGAPREECTYCCLPGFPSWAVPQGQLWVEETQK